MIHLAICVSICIGLLLFNLPPPPETKGLIKSIVLVYNQERLLRRKSQTQNTAVVSSSTGKDVCDAQDSDPRAYDSAWHTASCERMDGLINELIVGPCIRLHWIMWAFNWA